MENLALKMFTLAMLFIFLPIVNAQIQTLTENHPAGEDITLSQVCATCTFVNLQKVKFPNSTELYINTNMTKQGQTYYYLFSDTDAIGQYIITTCGDLSGVLQCANYDFFTTTNGEKFTSTQPLALMPLVALIAILFAIGFTFSREKWKIKSFFFLSAVLASLILINSSLIMFSTSSSLNLMGQSALILGIVVFSVYMVYILITYTIEVFTLIKEVKQKRKIQSDPY